LATIYNSAPETLFGGNGELMDRINGSNQIRKMSVNPADSRMDLQPPPPPDESYWSALLREGDGTTNGGARHSGSDWEGFEDVFSQPASGRSHDEEKDWQTIQNIFETDGTIELPVVGYNRGGLLVEYNSLRGFVPASQLVSFPAVNDVQIRRNELAARIGQKLMLRVIELDRIQNRLILSERAAQVQAGTRANVLDGLKPGDICQGKVTNLCDFGAFIDLAASKVWFISVN